jgi:hypothetical protein
VYLRLLLFKIPWLRERRSKPFPLLTKPHIHYKEIPHPSSYRKSKPAIET